MWRIWQSETFHFWRNWARALLDEPGLGKTMSRNLSVPGFQLFQPLEIETESVHQTNGNCWPGAYSSCSSHWSLQDAGSDWVDHTRAREMPIDSNISIKLVFVNDINHTVVRCKWNLDTICLYIYTLLLTLYNTYEAQGAKVVSKMA